MLTNFRYWVLLIVILNLSLTMRISMSSSVQMNVFSGVSSCTPGDLNMTHCSNGNTVTSYTCPDLDSALQYISNATQYGNISVAHVCLPSGYFTLTSPQYLNVSITLTGVINQSIIRCDYDSNNTIATSEDELQFTLSFSRVSFVRFDGVQFKSCPQPLRITLAEDVMISNSRFERFSEGVFDIFNSNNITIVNSSFVNNYGTGTVLIPFRGNTGAVAIGYSSNNPLPIVNPTVLVKHCLFINNSATVSAKSMLTSTNVIASGVFTGRGGGFGVFVQDSIRSVSIWAIDSEFIDNYAFSFGGGMYVALYGDKNQHNMTLQGCRFINNRSNLGAGGMLIVFLSNGDRRNPMTARFSNCYFARNYAETGGGMYIFPEYSLGGDGNVAFIDNCTFEDNEASLFGGAVSTAIYTVFRSTNLLPLYQIVNCTFKRNRCADGIVNIGYVPFVLKGNNVFMSNFGPAFRIIASVVQIHDEVTFIDNETPDGGALFINSFGQIKMYPNSSMTFEGNRGSIGAAIVVSTQTFPSILNKLINNPQCFLLYYTPGASFLDIDDVCLSFNNNTALEASAIFLTSAQQCSWIGNTPPFFNAMSVLEWPFFKINQSDGTTTRIETVAAKIDLANHTVSGWPGETLSLTVNLVDEINQNASELLQLEPRNHNNRPTTKYRMQPAFFYQQNQRKIDTKFAIDKSVRQEFSYGNASTVVVIEEPLIGNIKISFILNATRCPAGYRLAHNSELGGLTCQCNTDLKHIRNCEDDQRTILLTDGLWGVEQVNSADENLVAYPCPTGYCRCFLQHNNLGEDVCSFAYFNGDPDKQCDCERKGYLCGDCRDGKGVSALLNRCVDCSNAYGILIGVLVIIDGVLIIILLFKNVSFSALLFPTIFFINMVSYVGESFPTSYDQVGKYMYYLNSFLSLYFPYDFCLYSGTTALASFTFRYIPFSLSIIVCLIVVTWFRYSAKNTRKIPWDSLWLLLTLQYSHVIHTSMTVLNCPRVVNENGDFESRWFINGTLDCFTGRHIPLGLWSIAMLTVCVALIPLLALVAGGKIKKPNWFGQLARCLAAPFKEELPWWCAVELARKFMLLLFLIPFPQNTCPPLLILMTIFATYIYAMPHKEMLVNVVELLFQLILILFLLLRSTRDIVDDYLVFPYRNDIQDEIKFLNKKCRDNDTGVATLTWLLFPFAYLPLLIATILMMLKLLKQIWQTSKISSPTDIIRNYSRKKRASTYRVNAVNARHLTLEFVDGTYQTVARKDSNENNHEDENVAATAATESTIVKNKSSGVEENLTVTTENDTK